MANKVLVKLARFRFRLQKIRAAFGKPDNPMKILSIRRPGVGEYLHNIEDDEDEGITNTLQLLIDKGSVGDSVIITLDEMNANVFNAMNDWGGWYDGGTQ